MKYLEIRNQRFHGAVGEIGAPLLGLNVTRNDGGIWTPGRKVAPWDQIMSARQAMFYLCWFFGRYPNRKLYRRGGLPPLRLPKNGFPMWLHGMEPDAKFTLTQVSETEVLAELEAGACAPHEWQRRCWARWFLEDDAFCVSQGVEHFSNEPGDYFLAHHGFWADDADDNGLTLEAITRQIFTAENPRVRPEFDHTLPLALVEPTEIEAGSDTDFSSGRRLDMMGDRSMLGWTGTAQMRWDSGDQLEMTTTLQIDDLPPVPVDGLHGFSGMRASDKTTAVEPFAGGPALANLNYFLGNVDELHAGLRLQNGHRAVMTSRHTYRQRAA